MRIALALALFLAIAAPARADGTLFMGGVEEIGGVSLAGERVVWATETTSGAEVHDAMLDGSDRRAIAVTGPLRALAASERRLAIGLGRPFCRRNCAEEDFRITDQATLSAPLGASPLLRLERDCAPVPGRGPAVAVWSDVVAYHDSCEDATVVRDFASGLVRSYPEGDWAPRVAGEYLATIEGRALVLRNWRSGQELVRVPNGTGPHAVQPDGKVAFHVPRADGIAKELYWASPERPEPVPIPGSESISVRMAADRLALTLGDGTLLVRELDGAVVARSEVARAHDFDGSRVAWSTSPCAVAGIATWDLVGEPPDMPAGSCPFPVLRSRVLRADARRRRLAVKLACPAGAVLGCRGDLIVHAGTALIAAGGTATDPAFALAPGGATTVELRLRRRAACASGRRALRGVLDISVNGRHDLGYFRVLKRVRTTRVCDA